jgi:hypothetical protein
VIGKHQQHWPHDHKLSSSLTFNYTTSCRYYVWGLIQFLLWRIYYEHLKSDRNMQTVKVFHAKAKTCVSHGEVLLLSAFDSDTSNRLLEPSKFQSPQHGVRVGWIQEKYRTYSSRVFFLTVVILIDSSPPLVHNKEGAALQACRWTFRRFSLQVVYYRRWIPPPQQTLRTRLSGDGSWRYNVI